MVEKIERIRGTVPSSQTRIDNSLSITSEPDNTWYAKRQSTINENLGKRSLLTGMRDEGSDHECAADSQDSKDRDDGNDADKRLSGESERIGTGNWDDDVPDGEHVGYL
ncbi:hypothetical protein [Agrobacterium tumefaciens]|uniref:hypothetical protein n=1 Tax=Agrobacterium tumefaciens TaxID=358 RepID=UPI00287DD1C7|nr:hypothetical protein [Agrobacterium tumefaciens]MDS7595445.1 hypothetical protein [Agrobacterium tumefaciens]